jgi:hypothetical protein
LRQLLLRRRQHLRGSVVLVHSVEDREVVSVADVANELLVRRASLSRQHSKYDV